MGVTKAFIKNPETVRERMTALMTALLPRGRARPVLAHNGLAHTARMARVRPQEARGGDQDPAVLAQSERVARVRPKARLWA
jgi:hypothetical protein